MLLLTLTHDADAQLHIFKVVAGGDGAEGDSGDAADLGGGSERVDESHSSCKSSRYWHLLQRLWLLLHPFKSAGNVVVADRQAAHASAAH